MNYKHLEEWNSGTVERIVNRYPRSFFGAVIQGERGKGKSMYAYKVMAKVYMITEGLTEAEAYAKALEHFIFEPKDLISLVKKNIKTDYVTPVICLDDATVHFNSYKFFTDLYEVILLKGIFDTIRTAVTGLLFTCPNRRNLLKFLRDYDDHKISIISYNGFESHDRWARCYQFNWYPDEHKYKVIVPYQDQFSCLVPDEFYKPYLAKRKHYLEAINSKMEDLMKRADKQKVTRRLKNNLERDLMETEDELDA
jgi:hypothetical protein